MIRREGGRVLATLVRLVGSIDIAEDAVQDAVVDALKRWPADGVPNNPAAWLTTAARNRALDVLRRESKRTAKEADARLLDEMSVAFQEVTTDSMVRDDLLRLLFTCCHPALAIESRLALALRTLCSMNTSEIAAVFLVPEPTMGQRISRAKKKIASARIPYRVPADHELPDRLPSVLQVVYAVITAGHHSPEGRLDARADLAAEGVRLARLLTELMPDEPECTGLLALAMATHARRYTRLDATGQVVLLANQDRTRWHHDEMESAAAMLDGVVRLHRPGRYQVEAAIACLHGIAPSLAETDWPQIASLYATLEMFAPTPVVRVNRAVAVAQAVDAAAGLALLEEQDDFKLAAVENWHLYWSTRGELLDRLGDTAAATAAFDRALNCVTNDSDRAFLLQRRNAIVGNVASKRREAS
ncbi:MAG: sigma-70 family RNA polymerase sigma factor [Actinomycetia bacterium]|nr:sigma-70 family RNA polymerase sigma factor [Actinomycetes bacterium]